MSALVRIPGTMPRERTRPTPMLSTACRNCRKRYRWTKIRCPKCMMRNANHPAILLGKLLAVAALCAALWFLARAFIKTDDSASGVVPHSADKATPRPPMFPTPVPDRTLDPKLPR